MREKEVLRPTPPRKREKKRPPTLFCKGTEQRRPVKGKKRETERKRTCQQKEVSERGGFVSVGSNGEEKGGGKKKRGTLRLFSKGRKTPPASEGEEGEPVFCEAGARREEKGKTKTVMKKKGRSGIVFRKKKGSNDVT